MGYPVVELNIDSTQVEDRTDEALQMYQEYHYDAVERTYLKHKITATTVTLASAPGATLTGTITGGTSSATALIYDTSADITYRVRKVVGTFTNGETITDTAGTTATLAASSAIALGDIDNEYITIADG